MSLVRLSVLKLKRLVSENGSRTNVTESSAIALSVFGSLMSTGSVN